MATIAPIAHAARPLSKAQERDRSFFRLSLFCLTVGVLGFAPSYWVQVPAGTITVPPLIHLHGLIFTSWLVMLVAQSWLAASGRLRRHRRWGLAAISLATLVVAVGLVASSSMQNTWAAMGYAREAKEFFIVPAAALTGFATFFTAAITNSRKPEWHKRLVLVATFFLLPAAGTRLLGFALGGMHWGTWVGVRPPPSAGGPLPAMLLLDVVIVLAMIRDRRADGKVHPAWLWGFGALVTTHLLLRPLSTTGAWLAVADWFDRF